MAFKAFTLTRSIVPPSIDCRSVQFFHSANRRGVFNASLTCETNRRLVVYNQLDRVVIQVDIKRWILIPANYAELQPFCFFDHRRVCSGLRNTKILNKLVIS